jgi:uncharacterized membrane protein
MDTDDNRGKGHRRDSYSKRYPYHMQDIGPMYIILRLIWVTFLVLVLLSVIGGVFSYTLRISVGWLSNAWGAWGGLWIVFIIILIFFRPWRSYRYHNWYGYDTDEEARNVAKMRLANGDITIEEYRKIMSELKKKE